MKARHNLDREKKKEEEKKAILTAKILNSVCHFLQYQW